MKTLLGILATILIGGTANTAADPSPFYVVYFYRGDTLIRTLQIHGLDSVSDTCHEWHNADSRNKCRWILVP